MTAPGSSSGPEVSTAALPQDAVAPSVPLEPDEAIGGGERDGDLFAVGAAVAVWAGAAGALRPSPTVALAALLVVASLAARHHTRTALLVALVVVAGIAADRSEAGLVAPAPGPFSGEVTLVDDPEEHPGQARADVSFEGGRYELVATGGAAGTLLRASSGEHLVVVTGCVGAARGNPSHLRSRHIRGRIEASSLEPGAAPAPLWGMADAVRGRVARGAEVLPEANAALLVGLVFGDDRNLPAANEHDLRASGLAHLTAVSGQNVAFLLIIASPLLRRLGLAGRLVAVVALLVFFLVMTRVEPSVLRAATMAAVATAGTTFGRPVGGVRLVATAVVVLVLVDPMLVHSIGFALSVAATGGIVVVAGRISEAMPGPSWATLPVGVTVAAQLAVAPVLVLVGLGLPVVAVVTNPLAGPAAGWTMAWGLTAGWVAGWMPAWACAVIHLPTRASTEIVLVTARVGADLPVGSVAAPQLLAILAGAAALVVSGRGRMKWRPVVRCVGVVAISWGVVVAAVPDAPGEGRYPVAIGADVIVAGDRRVLVLDGRADPLRVLDGLDEAGISGLDLLVVRSAGPRVAAAARIVRSRVPAARTVAPEGAVAEAEPVVAVEVLIWPTGELVLRPEEGGLAVEGGELR